jgi:hypothetical protein
MNFSNYHTIEMSVCQHIALLVTTQAHSFNLLELIAVVRCLPHRLRNLHFLQRSRLRPLERIGRINKPQMLNAAPMSRARFSEARSSLGRARQIRNGLLRRSIRSRQSRCVRFGFGKTMRCWPKLQRNTSRLVSNAEPT